MGYGFHSMACGRFRAVRSVLFRASLCLTFPRAPMEHVTIKITTSNPDYGEMIAHECDINGLLFEDTSINGFDFIRPALGAFMINSPSGFSHLCLVFEPMREPLIQLQRRLPGQKIPPRLLKVYVDFLLMGIDYLHSKCHIIHTG
jgi:serine/threonine-protein kinase SRPK3